VAKAVAAACQFAVETLKVTWLEEATWISFQGAVSRAETSNLLLALELLLGAIQSSWVARAVAILVEVFLSWRSNLGRFRGQVPKVLPEKWLLPLNLALTR